MNEASPFQQGKDDRDLLRWEDKDRFQRIFEAQAVRSYIFLSFGIGLIALLLPILLVTFGGYSQHYSISSFYHVAVGPSRDILVGALCATGVFLFLFHGLSKLENWLLNFAGIAIISVAMNPMPIDQCGNGPAITIHSGSAIIFFVLLAIVAVFLSKGRIKYIIYPTRRRQFAAAYDLAGGAMVAVPVVVATVHFLGKGGCASHWIFWVECAGIWSFSAYWFVKTLEYCLLLRIRWTA